MKFAEEQEELMNVNTNFQVIIVQDTVVPLEAQQALISCIINIKKH